MDHSHFDTLVRLLAASRRTLVSGGLAVAANRLGFTIGDAKNKKKKSRKPRQPRPNAFGCLNVGARCKNAGQCCSGVCTGKKGKRKCRAHDTGTCDQTLPGLCSDPPTIALCNGSDSCACLTTTGNSNFCAQLGQPICSDCRKDTDCEALGLPRGSACLPTTGILCQTECPETGMACLPPCGVDAPEEMGSAALAITLDGARR